MNRCSAYTSSNFVDCYIFSSGSTVASVSTSYSAEYVLLTPGSSSAINNYIQTQGIPNLCNATLNVNGTVGKANATLLNSETAALVNSSSEYIRFGTCLH
jgi:uncharacterized membrane protein